MEKDKPDFSKMPRKELKAYVLSHRDDDEALAILIKTFKDVAPNRSMAETEEAFTKMLQERKAAGLAHYRDLHLDV